MEELDEGCSIFDAPPLDGDEHRKRFYRVAGPGVPGTFQPIVHCNCTHNQRVAITNRVCGKCPHPDHKGVLLLNRAFPHMTRFLHPTVPNSIYDMPKRHTGAKGLRYTRAAEQYELTGLNRTDSYCKMFVKQERFNPLAKTLPDPRAIQFRGAKYCVAFAAYLRPIEEQLYGITFVSDGVPHTRNVAKGMNSVERAHVLHRKMSHFNDPVVMSLDMSRFDKHVYTQHLRFAHRVYLSCCDDPTFREILQCQFNTTCFTTSGMKYKVKARRMSGDMDTAIGNILIMLGMVFAVCRVELKIPKCDCLDDGDDCLILLESEDAPLFMNSAPKLFLHMGMEVKLDAPVSSLFSVVFCQSSIVEFSPGKYKFVRDYKSVISKSFCGVRHWDNEVYRRRVINAIGSCELVINLGVPVLQSFASCLLRNTGSSDTRYASDGLRQRAARDLKHLGIKNISDVRPVEITEVARHSFAEAFGLSPTDQIRLERAFDDWTFSTIGSTHCYDDWDASTWSGLRTYHELSPTGFNTNG